MLNMWYKMDFFFKIFFENFLLYVDCFRICQFGDVSFVFGFYIDGGGVERWEKVGYGVVGIYDYILIGNVEVYDFWDVSKCVDVQMNFYDGLSVCLMF